METPAPRAIDHLVLPTRSLKAARERLTRLGFTVAPDGRHPFGTANCCVYLADGTFIEPLAQAEKSAVIKAIDAHNVFVTRDKAYRFRRGDEGFSAVVFSTDDADADHARLAGTCYPGGPMLAFSRPFTDAAGKTDTASFKLAFAADPRAPDLFFFTCQRVNAPKVDRSALQAHPNGVTRLKSVILSAPNSAPFSQFLVAASQATMLDITRNGVIWQVGNGTVELMDNQGINHFFGVLSNEDRGLQGRVIVFGVPRIRETEALLRSRGILCEKFAKRLFVHPAPGQGAIFAFEADA